MASTITSYLAAHFPPKNDRAPKLDGRRRDDHLQGVDAADARPAAARSAADGGRHDLVGRHVRKLDRPPESRDRRDEGVQARPDGAPAQHHRRSRAATSGTRATATAPSASSSPRPARSPCTRCRIRTRAIRTRRSSIAPAISGSRCRTATCSGGSSRRRGEIKLVTMPTRARAPYGIKEDSQGDAVDRLQRQQQDRARESGDLGDPRVRDADARVAHSPPGAHERRRHLVRRFLTRLSWAASIPKTGAIKEWPSPSGPASHPYAIEVIDDVVWYNESNQRPDALVRFDPKTERFQSWAIPSGVGIIRHMRVTPDGNLVIHQSSTNTSGS